MLCKKQKIATEGIPPKISDGNSTTTDYIYIFVFFRYLPVYKNCYNIYISTSSSSSTSDLAYPATFNKFISIKIMTDFIFLYYIIPVYKSTSCISRPPPPLFNSERWCQMICSLYKSR